MPPTKAKRRARRRGESGAAELEEAMVDEASSADDVDGLGWKAGVTEFLLWTIKNLPRFVDNLGQRIMAQHRERRSMGDARTPGGDPR